MHHCDKVGQASILSYNRRLYQRRLGSREGCHRHFSRNAYKKHIMLGYL